jgi:hypothetical protein
MTTPRCSCGNRSTTRCDHRHTNGYTCQRALCEDCAQHCGTIDLCCQHARAAAKDSVRPVAKEEVKP